MFESAAEADEGAPIEIGLVDGMRARGRLIWSRTHFAGVEFTDPLHPALILHLGYQVPIDQVDPWIPQDRLGRKLPCVSLKAHPKLH
jgi:hypothetical protein